MLSARSIRDCLKFPENRYLTVAVIAMIVLMVLLWNVRISVARDPHGIYANSPNHEWFSQQHNEAGMWCCNEADGHFYEGDYKIKPDGSVEADGHSIEAYKVLKTPNPTGKAVWWYVDGSSGRTTYCFAPGPMT